MQEFLTNNTVNCNLMPLTGYRTLVIFAALLESPKTNDEINDCLLHNQYIKERFSSDTLRIYINSLRAIGCEITGANKSNNKKYELISHPFEYDIPKAQLKALSKLSKSVFDKIDIEDVIVIEKFFKKLVALIKSNETKAVLRNNAVAVQIDRGVLEELIIHCKKKNQITFLYNSPKSGVKEIELVADRLSVRSGKLYLWGNNFTHMQYSFFSIARIIKICSVTLHKIKEEFPPLKVIYELRNHNEDYTPDDYEKIIEKTQDKLIIEAISKNEFSLMQKILYYASDCKILHPDDFKTKLVDKLKLMEESYESV